MGINDRKIRFSYEKLRFVMIPSQMKPWDVLAVGGVNIDYLLTVPWLPSHDEKVSAHFQGRFPGGPAANFACAASQLGLSVASVATVGMDQDGDLIKADFQRFGVDVSLLSFQADYQTPFTVILIDGSGERAIVVPDYKEQYAMDTLSTTLARTRSLYMMPVMFTDFLHLAMRAREIGVEVMVDIEANHQLTSVQFDQVLQYVTIASFNQSGFRRFTGSEPTLEAARNLLSKSLHTVVISMGKDGSLATTGDENAQCPAYTVPVVDTTGAGDAFNAGFMTGTFMSMNLDDRLRFANAVAALKIQHPGTRGHLPDIHEVRTWIGNNKN
jgi:ribokinase/sulfofructose kinase